MRQHSSDGTPIEIEVLSGHLLFIDPLYLDTIREESDQLKPGISESNYAEFVQGLEERFFPYGGGTLLGYLNIYQQQGTFSLDVSRIRGFNDSNPADEQAFIAKQITTFALDSGGLLLIDLANFSKAFDVINFDDLTDASEADFQLYQEKNNLLLGNKGWAYIESPGIGSGFDLVGSGSYVVTS